MYKLMINDGIRLITGSELEEILEGLDFQVPELVDANLLTYPPLIPRPIAPLGWYKDPILKAQHDAAMEIYKTYMTIRLEAMMTAKRENPLKLIEFENQFVQFADYLDDIFKMTKMMYDGKNTDGTKRYEYVEVPAIAPNYTFLQAAKRLIGYGCVRPVDPIDFICNQVLNR